MTPSQHIVIADCPVCSTGNRFILDEADCMLTCKDCGFMLTEPLAGIGAAPCVICGNDRFYFDSPLNLRFLGRTPTCYVCDARYEGFDLAHVDDGHSDETAAVLANSTAAKHLKERVRRY